MNQPRLLWLLKIFSMSLALVAVLWAMKQMKSPQFQSQAGSFFRLLETR